MFPDCVEMHSDCLYLTTRFIVDDEQFGTFSHKMEQSIRKHSKIDKPHPSHSQFGTDSTAMLVTKPIIASEVLFQDVEFAEDLTHSKSASRRITHGRYTRT